MGDDPQSKITTPNAKLVSQEVLAFLIREMNHAVDRLTMTVERISAEVHEVREAVARQTSESQSIEVLAEVQRRQGTAIERLGLRQQTTEGVLYEGKPPPRMHGPPDRRRPILDPEDRWDQSSSWKIPPDLADQISAINRRSHSSSFFRKERWRVAFKVAGHVLPPAVAAVLAWLIAHVTIHP